MSGARGCAPGGGRACRVHATGEPAGAGGVGATAGRPQALKDGALPLAFVGLFPLEIGPPAPALAEVFSLVAANL